MIIDNVLPDIPAHTADRGVQPGNIRKRGVSLDNHCLSSALPGIVLRAVDVLLTILGERDPYQAGVAHLEHTGTCH